MALGKAVTMIDVSEFDDLVQTTYGRVYSFQQQDGCKERGTYEFTVYPEGHKNNSYPPEDFENDTVPEEINGEEMGVSFKAWLARDPKEWNGDPEDARFVNMFWERNFYPHVDAVIDDLRKRGLIQPGTYVINIDW